MPFFAALPRQQQGFLLCALAAVGYGSMGVFAKLAYRAGANVSTFVSIRFCVGALLLWAIAARRGAVRIADPRAAVGAFALGLVLYSTESGLFAIALTTLDISLAQLLMFSYPAIVVVAAIVVGRERASARRLGAVVVASVGVACVLLGGASLAAAPQGVAFALIAAVLVAAYVFGADAISGRLAPLTFAALVCSGVAVAFTTVGTLSGKLQPATLTSSAWFWIAVVSVVSTAVAMTAFIAGIERLGPSRTAIMSTLDPLVAVLCGAVVFSEKLGPIQLLGGLFVVSAILILQVTPPPRLQSMGNRLATRSRRRRSGAPSTACARPRAAVASCAGAPPPAHATARSTARPVEQNVARRREVGL